MYKLISFDNSEKIDINKLVTVGWEKDSKTGQIEIIFVASKDRGRYFRTKPTEAAFQHIPVVRRQLPADGLSQLSQLLDIKTEKDVSFFEDRMHPKATPDSAVVEILAHINSIVPSYHSKFVGSCRTYAADLLLDVANTRCFAGPRLQSRDMVMPAKTLKDDASRLSLEALRRALVNDHFLACIFGMAG